MTATAVSPRHLSKTVEHYTPAPIVEAARATLGAIDLDPASCPLANETVRAARIYDRIEDGLLRPWSGRVFLNPPGGRDITGSVQRAWWWRVARSWDEGEIDSAIFVAFSIELLQTSQAEPRGPIPLDFPLCFPARRVAYCRALEDAATSQEMLFGDKAEAPQLEVGDSPPHASCIVYLPPRRALANECLRGLARFRAEFSKFGRVVRDQSFP